MRIGPRPRPSLLAILLGTTALTGCAHHRTAADSPVTPAEGWSLTVNNHHWLDVSIYVLYDGNRARLGTVSATHTETYDLPARMISTGRVIRLEANPIGATRALTTDALTVQGGQHVEWTLENGLERSSVAVW